MKHRRPRPIGFEVYMIVNDSEQLREARELAGLTQSELGRLANVTQQYISKLESGRDRDCSDRVAIAIARYTGKRHVSELFTKRAATSTVPQNATATRGSGRSVLARA